MPLDDRHTPYNVRVDFVYAESIEAVHEQVRRKFEPFVNATGSLSEVQVLAAICLRVARLAVAARLLAEKGLKEECQLPFRSAAESVVNLLYIFEVGPKAGERPAELAKQFLAYGDVAYYKMLTKRPAAAKRAFKKNYGWDDKQFSLFLAEKKQLRDDALVLGCEKVRWHRKTLAALATEVSTSSISYLDPVIADMLFSSFVSSNSATHADALSLRSQYKDLGNQPLEMAFSPESNYADITGWLATTAWYCLATYYNHVDWLKGVLDAQIRSVVKDRFEQARAKAHRVILLPPYL